MFMFIDHMVAMVHGISRNSIKWKNCVPIQCSVRLLLLKFTTVWRKCRSRYCKHMAHEFDIFNKKLCFKDTNFPSFHTRRNASVAMRVRHRRRQQQQKRRRLRLRRRWQRQRRLRRRRRRAFSVTHLPIYKSLGLAWFGLAWLGLVHLVCIWFGLASQ